jgi:Universal stress protein family
MPTPTATHDPATTDSLDDPGYRYQRILVAVDDSRESRLALARAADIARRANARLDLLVSAVVPSTTYWGGAAQSLEISSSTTRRCCARPRRPGNSRIDACAHRARGGPPGRARAPAPVNVPVTARATAETAPSGAETFVSDLVITALPAPRRGSTRSSVTARSVPPPSA